MEFSYALPASAQMISGEATFYKEEKAEQPTAHFETYLKIDGAPARAMRLTLDHPEFSFALKDIIRSAQQRRCDDAVEGLGFWQTIPWLVFIVAAFQLQLRTRMGRGHYYLGLLGAIITSALVITRHRLESSGYVSGIFIFLLGVTAVTEGALLLYRRRLQRVSESQADQLFTSQIRFVSLLLAGVTLLLIAQDFKTPS